jgi:hypothetical protein
MNQDREFLKQSAKAIQDRLPDNWSFILLAAQNGKPTDDSRLVYISSMDRACAINVLKEWLIKASGPEDWMKHIK